MGELYHYGVKGMKWGVRHDRKSQSDFNAYRTSNTKIRKNKDGSYTIPKNFVFNRVGSSALDVNKSSGLYVSYGKEDAARYVKNLGPSLVGRLLNMSHDTVQHISVKQNLKLASEQQTIDLLSKAVKSDKSAMTAFNDSIYSYAFVDGKKPSNKRTAFAVSAMLGNEAYSKYNKFILNECRKAGFDAIPDLNDLYTGTGTTSTIILNPDKIYVKESTYITKDIYKSGKKFAKSLGKLPLDEITK